MRQKFKQIFQPIEIALRKAFGIKKIKKGKIFDEKGFLQDGQEKLTRYALFVPFDQKMKLTTKGKGGRGGTTLENGGGGGVRYPKS